MTGRQLVLFLAETPKIGGKTIARIVARNKLQNRPPEEFLRLSAAAFQEEYGLTAAAAANLKQRAQRGLAEIEALDARLAGLEVSWLTMADAGFPERLDAFDPEPPAILFFYGNLSLLKRKTFCVLASRAATPRHLDQIEKRAEEGILDGEVLVSGTNRIEYQRSAVVPLRWGAPRILCLDQGFFHVLGEQLKDEAFPAARLWRYEFDPKTDLVVSPFRPNARFIGINNQVRDRLVASLSDRLDFVHIAPKGNMHRLVKLGIQSGRPVRVPSACLADYAGANPLPE